MSLVSAFRKNARCKKGPRRFRPLRFERFEIRALLAAMPLISEEDAIALAINHSRGAASRSEPQNGPIGTNDFRISDLGGDAFFDAEETAVAYNSADNEYLVVWCGDDDTGTLVDGELEVFGQRINAATGAAVGANDFRISDMGPDGDVNFGTRNPQAGLSKPAVAYNSGDNEYLVVWHGDDNTGSLVDDEFEIFGQRLTAAGAAIGANDFRISHMGPNGDTSQFAALPAIAYNSGDNEYLVVWRGDKDGSSLADGNIFGHRLTAAGTLIGVNDFRISSIGSSGSLNFGPDHPAIAYNSGDNEYLVVWYGDNDAGPVVDDEFEIYGQRLSAAGAELGVDDFRISDMGPDGDATFGAARPAIAYNSGDNEYLAVWTGDDDTAPLVNDEFETFGQRLSAVGAELGVNDFRITDLGPDGDTTFFGFLPAIAYNSGDNEYLVVWYGADDTAPLVANEFEIFGQRLSAGGAELGVNDFRVSDMGPNGDTNFAAALPAIAYNSGGNQYLVVWLGNDNTDPLVASEFEVFGQRISAAGAPLGANDFRISDMGRGDLSFDASDAAVAYNSTSNEYLVVWSGDEAAIGGLADGELEIFGQRINAATGVAVGVNDFRISSMGPDGSAAFDAFEPAVAYNSTNNQYLVVWRGDDDTAPLVNNEFEIFGQRLSSTGIQVGADDFRISDLGPDGNTSFGAFEPAVAYNSTNSQYLVVWRGDDDTAPLVDNEYEIFGQRLSGGGVELGTNDFRISDMGTDGNASFDAFEPAVAYNGTDNQFLVVWRGDDDTAPLVDNEYEIFGQRLSGTGAQLGTNDFRISDMGTDGNANFDAFEPAVTYNGINNQFLVVWRGDDNIAPLVDNEFEIFGQRLNNVAAAVGTNDFRISDLGPDCNPNFAAFRPVIAHNSTNNEYLVVWHGDDNTAPLVDNEREIFGQRLSSTGVAAGTNDFRISDMGPDGNTAFAALNAAVAYSSTSNQFFVVWQGDDNAGGVIDNEFEIFGQRFDQPAAAPAPSAASPQNAAGPMETEPAPRSETRLESQSHARQLPKASRLPVAFVLMERRVAIQSAKPAQDGADSDDADTFFSWLGELDATI